MRCQTSDTVLMIRPSAFRANEQTSVNNYFQKTVGVKSESIIKQAQSEFDGFHAKILAAGVNVLKYEDNLGRDTPDSLFPNNWISFHSDGKVFMYPMFAENRRLERRPDIVDDLIQKKFLVDSVLNYATYEEKEMFLEGTGSIIFDHKSRKMYCAISIRSNQELAQLYAKENNWTLISFHAFQTVDGKRKPIYHTNVMMCVGETFVVVCLNCIDDHGERSRVLTELKDCSREIIEITEDQVHKFAGNMLNVRNQHGKSIIVMSKTAFECLTHNQVETLKRHGDILHSDLKTIETCGGGSARCMLAEVFLPRINT